MWFKPSLSPSRLRLNRLGPVGVLEKTKTTGAGKWIRHLPIYMSQSAYVMAADMLDMGSDLSGSTREGEGRTADAEDAQRRHALKCRDPWMWVWLLLALRDKQWFLAAAVSISQRRS